MDEWDNYGGGWEGDSGWDTSSYEGEPASAAPPMQNWAENTGAGWDVPAAAPDWDSSSNWQNWNGFDYGSVDTSAPTWDGNYTPAPASDSGSSWQGWDAGEGWDYDAINGNVTTVPGYNRPPGPDQPLYIPPGGTPTVADLAALTGSIFSQRAEQRAKDDYLGNIWKGISDPWQPKVKDNLAPWEWAGDVANRAAGSFMGGTGNAIAPAAKLPGAATDFLADNNLPVISGVAGAVRTGFEEVAEPVFGAFTSAAGDLLKPGEMAWRGVFDRDAVTAEQTERKRQYIQSVYDGAIAQGMSDAEASRLAQAEDSKYTNYSQFAGQMAPSILTEPIRGIFEGDKVEAEYQQKKLGYVQQVYEAALAQGQTEAQALSTAQELDTRLNNPAMLYEYEGKQKYQSLPAGIQLVASFADPLANKVGDWAAAPVVGAAAKAAPVVADVTGISKVARAIESPQQKAYRFEQAADNVTAAIDGYAQATGTDFATAAQQFAEYPEFRAALGFDDTARGQVGVNSREVADYIGRELDTTTSTGALSNDGFTTTNLDPSDFSSNLKSNYRLDNRADLIDRKTGEIRPARALEQYGALGAIAAGPGRFTNNLLARLYLNSPGRLLRDPAGNMLKASAEDYAPFGSDIRTAAVDTIGIRRPAHLVDADAATTMANEFGATAGKNPLAKAAFTVANPQGEIVSSFLNKLSQIGDNRFKLGADVNETVGNWETATKRAVYDQAALAHFDQTAQRSAAQLAAKYDLPPAELAELISDGKVTRADLDDYALNRIGMENERQFINEVAAARQSARAQAANFASKEVDRIYFSYKKNVIQQAIDGWFPYSYWGIKNTGWIASQFARHPERLSSMLNFFEENERQNREAGVPEYARNQMMIGRGKDGSAKMWNYSTILPLTPIGGDGGLDLLTGGVSTITPEEIENFAKSGKPAPANKFEPGKFLFGQEKPGGNRDKGLLAEIFHLNPFPDIAAKTGMINEALRALGATDNIGAPGAKDKQTLGLIPGRSTWQTFGAATGLTSYLRSLGIKDFADLDPEAPANNIIFGPNAGKPVTAAKREIQSQVENGLLTVNEGKRAIASINAGRWDKFALKALDQVQAEKLDDKIIGFFGLPTFDVNTPRDMMSNELSAGYQLVKDQKGRYKQQTATNPKTGNTYQTSVYVPGEQQKYLDAHPGMEIALAGKITLDEAAQAEADETTRASLDELKKQKDAGKLRLRDYNAAMDTERAKNPGYFEAQEKRAQEKRDGKRPLLPGEKMPKAAQALAERQAEREFDELQDDYNRLGGEDYDALQQIARLLSDRGDKRGAAAIYQHPNYQRVTLVREQFLADNPRFAARYKQEYKEKYGKDYDQNRAQQAETSAWSALRREYQDVSRDYNAFMNDYITLRDAGRKAEANAIYKSPQMTQAKARRENWLAARPGFKERYDRENKARNNR